MNQIYIYAIIVNTNLTVEKQLNFFNDRKARFVSSDDEHTHTGEIPAYSCCRNNLTLLQRILKCNKRWTIGF